MKPQNKLVLWAITLFAAFIAVTTQAQPKKPNILVIWGDDIGNQNISYNSHGMMGYTTLFRSRG